MDTLMLGAGTLVFLAPRKVFARRIDRTYKNTELVRAWASYAVALGLVYRFPRHKRTIVRALLVWSILWHVCIVHASGTTSHHLLAIGANALGLVL